MLQYQVYWEGRYRNDRITVSTIPNYKSMRQARHGKGGLSWRGNPTALLLH